jgi:hypothetical protein
VDQRVSIVPIHVAEPTNTFMVDSAVELNNESELLVVDIRSRTADLTWTAGVARWANRVHAPRRVDTAARSATQLLRGRRRAARVAAPDVADGLADPALDRFALQSSGDAARQW